MPSSSENSSAGTSLRLRQIPRYLAYESCKIHTNYPNGSGFQPTDGKRLSSPESCDSNCDLILSVRTEYPSSACPSLVCQCAQKSPASGVLPPPGHFPSLSPRSFLMSLIASTTDVSPPTSAPSYADDSTPGAHRPNFRVSVVRCEKAGVLVSTIQRVLFLNRIEWLSTIPTASSRPSADEPSASAALAAAEKSRIATALTAKSAPSAMADLAPQVLVCSVLTIWSLRMKI